MGMRLGWKASFDISGFSAANPVILTGLGLHGIEHERTVSHRFARISARYRTRAQSSSPRNP
jgi:hypothetical protein